MNEKTVRDIWNGRTWFRETHCSNSARVVSDRLQRRPGRPKGSKDVQPRRRRHFEAKNTDDAKYKDNDGDQTSSAAASAAGDDGVHCQALQQPGSCDADFGWLGAQGVSSLDDSKGLCKAFWPSPGPLRDNGGETKLGLLRTPNFFGSSGGGGGCVPVVFAGATPMDHSDGRFFGLESSFWSSYDNGVQASMPQKGARWRRKSAGGAGSGSQGCPGFAECCQPAAWADSPWIPAANVSVDLHRRSDPGHLHWASFHTGSQDNSKAQVFQSAAAETEHYGRLAVAAGWELSRGDINVVRRGGAQPDVGGGCHPPDSFAAAISSAPSLVRAAPRLLLDVDGFVLAPSARPSFGSDIQWQKDAAASATRSAASLAVTALGSGFWGNCSSPTLREDLSAAGAHFTKDDGVEDDPFHDDWAYWPKPLAQE